MGQTCRSVSRICTGIAMSRWCIGIRTIPICITGTATSMCIELGTSTCFDFLRAVRWQGLDYPGSAPRCEDWLFCSAQAAV